MFRRDYLLGMIEQMTVMLGQVMGLRKENKFGQAIQLLDDMLAKQFRLSPGLVNGLSVRDLIDMIKTNDFADPDLLIGLAGVIGEQGNLHRDLDKHEESIMKFHKSLQLYLAALDYGAAADRKEIRTGVDDSLRQLRGYDLSEDIRLRLTAYFEASGQYGRAEDQLYEWCETEERREMAMKAAAEFYGRLLAKSDRELEEGNLPREEIREAVRELGLEPAVEERE